VKSLLVAYDQYNNQSQPFRETRTSRRKMTKKGIQEAIENGEGRESDGE